MNAKMDDEQFDDLAIEYDMTRSPARKAKLKQRLINILDKDPEMLCATKALIFDPDFKVYENQMKLNTLADCDNFDLEMAENRIEENDKTQKDTIQNRINGDGYEAGQCDGDLFQKIKEWDGKIMTGVKTAIIVSAMYLGIAGVPGLAKKDTNLSLLENIAVAESHAGDKALAQKYNRRGNRAYKQKKYEKAKNFFEKGIAADPTMSTNYSMLAGSYLELNINTEKIIPLLQKSLQLDDGKIVGNTANAHGTLAYAYKAQGQKEKALEEITIFEKKWLNKYGSLTEVQIDYIKKIRDFYK